MPANGLRRTSQGGTYSHIYNKGIEDRTIFNDKEDFEVFISYLKEYLSPPQDPNTSKKTFTIGGRTFQGVPHQPKNYFNQVELVAYSLMPQHFHLILYQTINNSIKGLLRSLFTRYSIYFNKKYHHTGALFAGPYKSVHAKDPSHLLYLSHHLHQNGEFSSYPEFLGERSTPWVKPDVVLNALKANGAFESYKDFVENHQLDQNEKEALNKLIIENQSEPVEKIPVEKIEPVRTEIPSKLPENIRPASRMPIYAASLAGFLVLLGLGIRNINATEAVKISESSPPPQTISITTPSPEVAAATTSAKLIVDIGNSLESVNIRESPATASAVIGKANAGDAFEYVSEISGWYGVKLTDGTTGYILSKFLKPEAK